MRIKRPKRNRSAKAGHIPETILADPQFQGKLARLAEKQGQPVEEACRAAERYLREIATRPSRPWVALAAKLGWLLYRRAYGRVHYYRQELAALARLNARHPIVFLPCHRSNLDRPVMHYLMWQNGLGPNFTAGGINMNFFPIGTLSRHAGVFFIRRSFTNNPIYKLALQTYLAQLVEQRRPLEWYIEGGRSRTGKIRSPRYGLLGYAADALAAGRRDDLYLIPTSINYDHVLEVSLFADEQRGVTKEKETLGWLVKSVSALKKRYGDIHIRFGEPLSMRSAIDLDLTDMDRRQDLQRLAISLCRRINRITPVTPASLAAVALLSEREGTTPLSTLRATVADLADHVQSRSLPSTRSLARLSHGEGLEDVLQELVELDLAVTETGLAEPHYRMESGQRLAGAYYRNTIVHFFLSQAIAELALAAAISRFPPGEDSLRDFQEQAVSIRDLLGGEFFFPDRDTFLEEISTEMDHREPDWKNLLSTGHGSEVLQKLRPHRAPWALRSFLGAYLVVAAGLADLPEEQRWNRGAFVRNCLERGAQSISPHSISAESVSRSLFSNALRVAGRRGLLKPGSEHLSRDRIAFAFELQVLLELTDTLDSTAPPIE